MKYQYWLANIAGVGNRAIYKILSVAGSAEETYHLKKEQLEKIPGLSENQIQAILNKKKIWDLEKKQEELSLMGIDFISCEMERFPEALKNISDPPYCIYVKGRLPDPMRKRVAIVGARMCSEYGKAVALKLGEKLSAAGAQIISGMARGIDSYGHQGALRAQGETFAVLGCGVEVCYPESNRPLYGKILDSGGIISEYPPFTQPIPMLFPSRNRIISAFSDVIVIVEAKERSGSLITADFALEQGKDIYAVPGRITDSLNQGCNNLIRQGAGILNSVEDFMKDIELCVNEEQFQENFNKLLLEKDESLVYSCVDLRPKSIEELLKRTGFSMQHMADLLQSLVQKEFITETFKNYYIRKI